MHAQLALVGQSEGRINIRTPTVDGQRAYTGNAKLIILVAPDDILMSEVKQSVCARNSGLQTVSTFSAGVLVRPSTNTANKQEMNI